MALIPEGRFNLIITTYDDFIIIIIIIVNTIVAATVLAMNYRIVGVDMHCTPVRCTGHDLIICRSQYSVSDGFERYLYSSADCYYYRNNCAYGFNEIGTYKSCMMTRDRWISVNHDLITNCYFLTAVTGSSWFQRSDKFQCHVISSVF